MKSLFGIVERMLLKDRAAMVARPFIVKDREKEEEEEGH
jgi:hypothetical protein